MNTHNTTPFNILALALATGALFLFGELFASIACWGIYLPVALAAWPIARYQTERSLLHRHAILDSVTMKGSSVRRWLWAGRMVVVGQVFVALVMATCLLAFLSLLRPLDWGVLGIDVLLLAWLANPISRRLAGQVQGEYLGTVTRMWPLFWLNAALLAVGFWVVDFFLSGSLNTTREAWHVVAERAFSEGSHGVSCQAAGWAVGALWTLDRLSWHAAQVLIPSIPGWELKLIAWGVVLLQAGLLGYIFTRYQLGVLALTERRQPHLGAITGARTKAFVITILVLALPYLYASLKLQDLDPGKFTQAAGKAIEWTNPCRPDQPAIRALQSRLGDDLKKAREDAMQRANQGVDKAVDAVFADVEMGVDRYLDWYFSVVGEYERLLAAGTGAFAKKMEGELNRHLFDDTRLVERLEEARQRVAADSQERLIAMAGPFAEKIKNEAAASPCQIEALDMSALGNLDRDRLRASVAAGGGALAGTATAMALANKAAVTFASKLAAKQGFKAAAGLAGKVVTKKAGAILISAAGATAVCSPTGPFAVICGIGAAVITWFTIDKVSIEIDEKMFRAKLRAELLDAVKAYREVLARNLKLQQHAAIEKMVGSIHGSIDPIFIPARDGL